MAQARTTDPREEADPPRTGAVTRIMLRPVASSLPLGFFAFGMGSILMTAAQLHWVPLGQVTSLMVLSLVFVVPLELLAGVFAFLARDGGAATALSALGCAWAGNAVVTLLGSPGQRSPALGIFLLTLVPLMLVFFAGAIAGKPVFALLLLAGACRFGLAGAYEAAGSATLEGIAGWVGVALSAFALYGGLALLLEDTSQRTVLPIGRVGRSRTAMEGRLAQQVHHTEHEAGVRRLL
jgi:succinate-acetate transporter protein